MIWGYHYFWKHPYRNRLGVAPSQDSSHHQEYETFLVGDPELNLHFPLLLGGGHILEIELYITCNVLFFQTKGSWNSEVLFATKWFQLRKVNHMDIYLCLFEGFPCWGYQFSRVSLPLGWTPISTISGIHNQHQEAVSLSSPKSSRNFPPQIGCCFFFEDM